MEINDFVLLIFVFFVLIFKSEFEITVHLSIEKELLLILYYIVLLLQDKMLYK
jgi:hypothetical protein